MAASHSPPWTNTPFFIRITHIGIIVLLSVIHALFHRYLVSPRPPAFPGCHARQRYTRPTRLNLDLLVIVLYPSLRLPSNDRPVPRRMLYIHTHQYLHVRFRLASAWRYASTCTPAIRCNGPYHRLRLSALFNSAFPYTDLCAL